jgi:lysophospholipase L1-like esterase
MKHPQHRLFLITTVLFGSLFTAHAQTPPSPTAIPSDGNFHAHPRWNARCIERVGAMIGKPCDILFIGDSITQNFGDDKEGNWDVADGVTLQYLPNPNDIRFPMTGRSVWEKYYGHRNALNFGVGADRTEHILWRMDNLDIRQFKPRVVVILAGTNDTDTATPAQIAEGVKAVVDKAHQMFPAASIILVSILPKGGAVDKIAQTNNILKTFADNHTIYYLDVYSQFKPAGDGWEGIGFDKVHLYPQGYEIWASTMEPLLRKLL